MQITLNDYIVNPMGKKNAVLNATAREAMRNDYKRRYDALMMREHGNIQNTLYKDEENNIYVAHFKIPSETINKFYYDVVFEFYADENITEAGTNLFKYYCQFFSNDPAFVYTYAFVFNKEDLLISRLRSKMSRKAIRDSAKEKNPANNVGYVKSIYFAYLYMQSRQLNMLNTYKAFAITMSRRNLVSDVMAADDKIRQRQEAGEKLKAQEKRNKERSDRIRERKPEVAKVTKTINGRRNGKMGNVNIISRKRSSRRK